MRNDIDEMVQRWSVRQKASLAESSEMATEETLRAIANRPRTRPQSQGSGSWLLRLTPAAAAVVCVVLLAILPREQPHDSRMVYEVSCTAVSLTEVPAEPLVPVTRYTSLFQEN